MNLITYGHIIDKNKFRLIKNELAISNKPRGGLWCCPVDNVRFDWKYFCELEDFRRESLGTFTKFHFSKPKNLLKIKTAKDVEQYTEILLPTPDQIWLDRKYKTINFEKLAQDYDGIWLTEEAYILSQQELRPWESEEHELFCTWDCECLLLFNLDNLVIDETVYSGG